MTSEEATLRFKVALRNASAMHIAAGLYRLGVVPWLVRSDSSYGAFHRQRLHQQQYRFAPNHNLDEQTARDAEIGYRNYGVFILVYGMVLAAYRSFGSCRMQRLAVTIETFRISCYVFVTTMDGFDFDEELSGEKFLKQIWDLIGVFGILGNICAVCADA
jgi:hypothetical protein